MDNIKYRWSDAWLLASIALASEKEPAELWRIFCHGEQLNKTIFTSEEIESGLVRLTMGKWVLEIDDSKRFNITVKFKKLNFKIKGFSSLLKLEKILKTDHWSKDEPLPHPDNNLRYPGINKMVLNDAYKEYKKKYRKYMI